MRAMTSGSVTATTLKLHVLSDLHLEFAPFVPPSTDADVVVLAGDIHIRTHGVEWAKRTFPDKRVVYVAGNHEYYGKAIPHLTDKLRACAAGSNVSVLDEETVTIDGVRFVGATMWTDWSCTEPHHAPSARSLSSHRTGEPLSAAYASDLEAMMDGTRAALVRPVAHRRRASRRSERTTLSAAATAPQT